MEDRLVGDEGQDDLQVRGGEVRRLQEQRPEGALLRDGGEEGQGGEGRLPVRQSFQRELLPLPLDEELEGGLPELEAPPLEAEPLAVLIEGEAGVLERLSENNE